MEAGLEILGWLLFSPLSLLFVLYLLVAPGLGIAAFRRIAAMRRRIDEMSDALARVGREQAELKRAIAATGATPAQAPPPTPAPKPVEPWAVKREPEPVPTAAPPPPSPPPPVEPGLEERLASRWLVWIGGATLALASAFLVKYSIDRGLLSPAVRVVLGALFGLALIAGGEWLRQRPLRRALGELRPDAVPPALVAAGLFALFASVYSGYALYGLLPPFLAFVLLGLVAAASGALALWHGPFVALLGIVAGYATPFLVSTGEPSAWGLFPYLLALTAGALVVVRAIEVAWLAWAALAGASLWPLLWMDQAWGAGDTLPVAAYLLLLSAAFIYLGRRPGGSGGQVTLRDGLGALALPERAALVGALSVAGLGYALVRMDLYGSGSLVFVALLVAFYLFVARREPALDVLAPASAGLVSILLASWHLPRVVTGPSPLGTIMGERVGDLPAPVLPPELESFALVGGGWSLLIAGLGFAFAWGAKRPGVFAWSSALAPVLALAIGYWRVLEFGVDLGWTVVALALAAVAIVVAERGLNAGDRRVTAGIAAAYFAAGVAALSLGAAMLLEEAWLTLALALQLPAIAWLYARLEVDSLRRLAAVVAGVVLVRLAFNPNVFDYALPETPMLNWLLYGYGAPALAFGYAARSFRARRDDWLVGLLEGGALALFALLIFFELRVLMTGRLDSPRYDFAEQSLQALAWLSLSFAILRSPPLVARPVLRWAGIALLGIAAAQVALLHLLIGNPLFTPVKVGAWPFVNLLALGYLAPGAFALMFARLFQAMPWDKLAKAVAAFGLVLIFAWANLETRHLFVGDAMDGAPIEDGELYAYSVVWILFAGGLLALGLREGQAALRYASLALLMLAVGKVFLIDMSALEDLWRVASFLGLGASLIGIARLYQRFVFPAGLTKP